MFVTPPTDGGRVQFLGGGPLLRTACPGRGVHNVMEAMSAICSSYLYVQGAHTVMKSHVHAEVLAICEIINMSREVVLYWMPLGDIYSTSQDQLLWGGAFTYFA